MKLRFDIFMKKLRMSGLSVSGGFAKFGSRVFKLRKFASRLADQDRPARAGNRTLILFSGGGRYV
jgi:hypothetical protein